MERRLTKDDIRGVMPPMVTPFTENEELDLDALRREMVFMLDLGVTGLVVGGSTGEGYALTPEELQAICRVAVAQGRGRVPVLAGVIAATTRDAVRRAQLAKEAGVDGLMITPVIYHRPSDECLLAFYSALASVVDLPIMVYNVLPQNPVSPHLLQRLSEIPAIIAVKESVGGSVQTLEEIVATLGDKIAVTWAQDMLMLPGYAVGAVGSITAITTILPEHALKLFAAVQAGDLATARRIHKVMLPVVQALGPANWPAGIKAAINLQGRGVGPARHPYISPPAEQIACLREALARASVLAECGAPRRPIF